MPGDCLERDPDVRPDLNAAKPTCSSLVMLGHNPNTAWTWSGRLGAGLTPLGHASTRCVIDQTGVTDEFIIRLEFHPDENTPEIHVPPGRDVDSSVAEAPSIFTALEEQIGLTVEKTKGPRGYLVIDHVEPLGAGR